MSALNVRHPPASGGTLDRICVRGEKDILLLPVRSVLYVRQDNGHSIIQLDQQTLEVRMSLKRLEGALSPFGFFRSHRAFLVNLRRVRRIVPWSRHVHHLLLDDPKETMVPLAKGRRAALRDALLWPWEEVSGVNVYQRTLLMLDACNLSGLGHSFSKEIIPAIWDEVRQAESGTKQFNEHPLAVLWIMKMASLAYPECLCPNCVDVFSRAYIEVKKRSDEGAPCEQR
jgi:hypothetical protein